MNFQILSGPLNLQGSEIKLYLFCHIFKMSPISDILSSMSAQKAKGLWENYSKNKWAAPKQLWRGKQNGLKKAGWQDIWQGHMQYKSHSSVEAVRVTGRSAAGWHSWGWPLPQQEMLKVVPVATWSMENPTRSLSRKKEWSFIHLPTMDK